MRRETLRFDFCVVGGGMAGLLAALAAARRGLRTALVQDRPVLGGNASSEIRMHICGAQGPGTRETGILEDIMLEQIDRNPTSNYAMWDAILYGKALVQPGLTLFLNASVNACETLDGCIRSVTAWQMTTETFWTIEAGLFADCSGDGILAPLSGAAHALGRESRDTFGESIAPERADAKTMGMSCLLQAREYASPQPFRAPEWAKRFDTPESLNGRIVDPRICNFWWMEVGGDGDVLHDAETNRAELLKIAFGVWDYVKNRSPLQTDMVCWAMEWVGFLPGKRESRRYVGDHVLTQGDIEAGGAFQDLVAYGGWPLDDHFPGGIYHPGAGNVCVKTPSPFGIPFRSLYARDIANLFCAGRCHSASHAALSATRVMGTTALMGQAVGTAAAICRERGLMPRELHATAMVALQDALMDDDVWLPGLTRPLSEVSRRALLEADTGDPDVLRNGVDRQIAGGKAIWRAAPNTSVTYRFDVPTPLREVRLVFDSDLDRKDPARNRFMLNQRSFRALADPPFEMPATLVKAFRLEALLADGTWATVHRESRNIRRLVRVPLAVETRALRCVPESTWGAESAGLFAFDVR